MTLVFAAIAPHGGLVFEQPDGETRRGMDELARRFAAAEPEAVVVVTPHGTLLDDRFGVVRAGRLSEHGSRFVDAEHLYEGPGEPTLADACIQSLRESDVPVVGLTFGATVAGDSEMPIDWGAGIPLSFLSAPAVVVTPCRALSNGLHVRAGRGAGGRDRKQAGRVRGQRRPRSRALGRRAVRLLRALGALRRRDRPHRP